MTTTTVATRSNVDWHERAPRALNRTLTFSFAIHIGAVVLLFVLPRSWFTDARPQTQVMTISLAGSPGQKTSGTTQISSKTVEEVAPPVRTPPRPPEQKPDPSAGLVKSTPQAPIKPVETSKPTTDTRPPTTGQRVAQGTARVDTGVQTLGEGLTIPGGEGTGGETDLANFCCPEYITTFSNIIRSNWQRDPNGKGMTIIRFTINKDGSITGAEVTQPSGIGLLDRAAQRALEMSRLPPLPSAYPNKTLIIRLGFDHNSR